VTSQGASTDAAVAPRFAALHTADYRAYSHSASSPWRPTTSSTSSAT